jgi:hypothetical protein
MLIITFNTMPIQTFLTPIALSLAHGFAHKKPSMRVEYGFLEVCLGRALAPFHHHVEFWLGVEGLKDNAITLSEFEE